MLVLSRKTNQSILIDGNIRVTVTKIRGNHVSLGIEAPGSVGIFRGELRPDGGAVQDQDPPAIASRLRNRSRMDSSQSSAGTP
jgi:carbon storage regulator CsrA